MASTSNGRARVGILIALPFALTACTSELFGERDRLVDAVVEGARAAEADRLEDLAGRADALEDELHDELSALMVDLEPPPGVVELRVPHGDVATSRGEGFLQVTRPMVVVPEEGDPFCAVVGLGSDGAAAGSRADGEVGDDCAAAVIGSQTETAADGNPLDLWDQTDQPV